MVGSQSKQCFVQTQSPSPAGGDPQLHTGLSLFSLARCQELISSRAPGNQEHWVGGETQGPARAGGLLRMAFVWAIP